jgi:hypothetical protein
MPISKGELKTSLGKTVSYIVLAAAAIGGIAKFKEDISKLFTWGKPKIVLKAQKVQSSVSEGVFSFSPVQTGYTIQELVIAAPVDIATNQSELHTLPTNVDIAALIKGFPKFMEERMENDPRSGNSPFAEFVCADSVQVMINANYLDSDGNQMTSTGDFYRAAIRGLIEPDKKGDDRYKISVERISFQERKEGFVPPLVYGSYFNCNWEEKQH